MRKSKISHDVHTVRMDCQKVLQRASAGAQGKVANVHTKVTERIILSYMLEKRWPYCINGLCNQMHCPHIKFMNLNRFGFPQRMREGTTEIVESDKSLPPSINDALCGITEGI